MDGIALELLSIALLSGVTIIAVLSVASRSPRRPHHRRRRSQGFSQQKE